MRNSKAVIGISGAIIIAFTLGAFFLLDIERIALYIWALAFLLLSEVILCLGLLGAMSLGANHSKVFARTGLTGVLSLYFISTLISVVFVGKFVEKLNSFILMELGIISLFAIVAMSVLAFSRNIKRINDKDAQKVGSNEPKRGGF